MKNDKDEFRYDSIPEKPTVVVPPFVHVGITYDPRPHHDDDPVVIVDQERSDKRDSAR